MLEENDNNEEMGNNVPMHFVDITNDDGDIVPTGFYVRPFTKELLQMANKHFEVAVFTAGYKWYADKIIDFIDPTGELI
jgi:hypothetical protein